MFIVIHGLNFAPELTGIGKYTGELAEYLAEAGHAVRAITTPPYYPQWAIRQGYSGWRYYKENWQGIEVFRCPLWIPKEKTGIKRLLHLASFAISSVPALLLQIFWKPDVVFCVSPTLLSVPMNWLVARLVGAKAWLHIQDFEIDAALGLGMMGGGNRYVKTVQQLEGGLYRRFDRVSTISRNMQKRLWEKDVEQEKTSLLVNWVDTEAIFPLLGKSPYYDDLGLSDEQVVVLYAGNMGVKQGLHILIEAAGLLVNETAIQFVLSGDGAVRANLEKQALYLPNVVFLSLQPVARLNELLNLAAIHVLPQLAGAADLVMPSKLSGMLASAKAVIAMADEDTEIGRVVGEVGWLVPPGNAKALAEMIRTVAAQPAERQRKGRLGRQYAQQHWDRKRVLDNFLIELEEMVSASS